MLFLILFYSITYIIVKSITEIHVTLWYLIIDGETFKPFTISLLLHCPSLFLPSLSLLLLLEIKLLQDLSDQLDKD